MYLLEDHDQYSTSFVQFFAWFETIILSYLSWCPLLPQPLYPPHTWRHYASDGSQLELPWEHKNTTHLGGRKQIWSLHYYLCWSLERNLVNNGLEMKGIFTFVKENWEIQCCNEILLSMDHWVCYKISPYKTITVKMFIVIEKIIPLIVDINWILKKLFLLTLRSMLVLMCSRQFKEYFHRSICYD